jgi:energy-coupling factor transporter ATP-binding protein EcfA2
LTGLKEQAGKLYSAFKGIPDYAGRAYSKPLAILNAFGIKTSILRPEEQLQFQNYDKQTKLKSIDKEINSYMMNKKMTVDEKRELINQLRKIRQEIITSPQ